MRGKDHVCDEIDWWLLKLLLCVLTLLFLSVYFSVSLEILEDGSPKPPEDALNDGLPKLYIHHNAFLKVLGTLVDVDLQTMTPIIYDREGNKLDPNA